MSVRSAMDALCDVPSPEDRSHAGRVVRRGASRCMMVRSGVARGLLSFCVVLAVIAGMTVRLQADGAGDNDPKNVRRLPKLGIEVPAAQRESLEAGLAKLRAAIDGLPQQSPRVQSLVPDIEIYYKAVHDALRFQEFYQPKEIEDAAGLLQTGLQRAEQLAAGQAPWTTATGLVVRGYRSRIDQSIQPFGLIVPASYSDRGAGRFRLDLWFHGRGETLTENNFIRDRSANPGTFVPADTFVLHPYGRYNNAFKFAGEVDVLEALDAVKNAYRIDEDRISVRGFSMGGAAAWQFAVHYADRWFAANPGAGFSETPAFLRSFQQQTLTPTVFEEKLWHWYDCTDWCVNLRHCPTVAYSGDQDVQKQAADIMAEALAREGMRLTHVIGPNTKHSYHPAARDEVERRMASLAERGRQRFPQRIDFVTYTLKYNRMHWLTVDGLQQHWGEPARVTAQLLGTPTDTIQLRTQNVTALSLEFPPGHSPLPVATAVKMVIDGTELSVPGNETDGSWRVALSRQGGKSDGKWGVGELTGSLRKRHGLQGPIDDAFMDRFLFVAPTATPANAIVGQWVTQEMDRAVEQWRRHFRGQVQVKADRDVTDDDVARNHVVIWGDPASNVLLARMADQLPIRWNS
ncbi:MAG: hypothetical protein RIS70_2706, partial [Planctomycetota bacterium]